MDHAFPGSARLGLYAGEWDPGWWTLLVLRKLGLVWNIQLPSDLPERPELRALDGAALVAHHPRSPSLVDTWRLISIASPSAVVTEGPAALISAKLLRRLLGNGFVHAPSARRLSASVAGVQLVGLPALCIALAARRGTVRVVAALALPLAFGAERVRQGLRYG